MRAGNDEGNLETPLVRQLPFFGIGRIVELHPAGRLENRFNVMTEDGLKLLQGGIFRLARPDQVKFEGNSQPIPSVFAIGDRDGAIQRNDFDIIGRQASPVLNASRQKLRRRVLACGTDPRYGRLTY